MTIQPVSYEFASRRGTPAFEELDTYTQQNLLAGSEPGLSPTVRILLASTLVLAAFTVVGLDANKKLVKATWNADPSLAITPIGVLLHATTSGAANTTDHGEVFLSGNFNAGADSPLVWDASFDTLLKKTSSVVGNNDLMFRSRLATGTPGI